MSKYEINKEWCWQDVPTTHKSLEMYFSSLCLSVEVIKNKKILDIGAGTREFARSVNELNIGSMVFSLDPIYSLSIEELLILKDGIISGEIAEYMTLSSIDIVKKRTVAALAERLPFRNESFDLVVSLFCLPRYANGKRQVDDFFSDVTRVTKKGGEIRLSPVGLGAIKKREVTESIDDKVKEMTQSKSFLVVQDKDLLVIKKINAKKAV